MDCQESQLDEDGSVRLFLSQLYDEWIVGNWDIERPVVNGKPFRALRNMRNRDNFDALIARLEVDQRIRMIPDPLNAGPDEPVALLLDYCV